MSIALANSPLPSARKSILPSAPVDFFHAYMKKTSFAPGTAKSATLRPLKISSVVFQTGPSVVMTRNLASGNRSPTLIGMDVLSRCGKYRSWLGNYAFAAD
jgi:hypothetical protein